MAGAPEAGAPCNDLHQLVHAADEELPSDLVSCPVVRSDGNASCIMLSVVVLALVVANILACVLAVFNTVLIISRKAPRKCRKACRMVIDQRTRTTRGGVCCLPMDHGSVWNQTCPEHVPMSGRESSFEYRTLMILRWCQRVLAVITPVCQLATRSVGKWSGCRWATGALVFFLLHTAFMAPQGHQTFQTQLPWDELLCLPGPPEQIAGWVDLPDGYHKRARAYTGTFV